MEAKTIRLLVVDDELPIRQELAAFPWEKAGFLLVGTARNGREALVVCGESRPDVVLTDITMPVMDGLELIKILKQQYPQVKCVILTCHQDFAYAKQAIQQNAVDYLLKLDLSEPVILELLHKVRRLVEQGWEHQERITAERRLRFSRLLSVPAPDETMVRDELKALRFRLDPAESCYFLLVENWLHSWVFVELAVREMLCALPAVSSWILMEHSCYALRLTQSSDEAARAVLARLQEEIQSKFPYAMEQFQLTVVAVTGLFQSRQLIAQLGRIPSWKAYAFYHPQERFFAGSLVDSYRNLAPTDWAAFQALMRNALKEPETADRALIPWALEQMLWPDCLLELFREWLRFNRTEQGAPPGGIPERHFQNAHNVVQAFILLKRCCGCLPAFSYRPEIRKAVQIIQAEYGSGVSLQDVAQRVGLSAPYLSRLFGEEVGENFNDYITRVRIEAAQRLIQEGGLKVYEIAQRVGLPNYRYFSAIFKKWTGKTPKDMRTEGPGTETGPS